MTDFADMKRRYKVIGSWRRPKVLNALDAEHAVDSYIVSFNGLYSETFGKDIGKKITFEVTVMNTGEVLQIPRVILKA